MKIKDLRNLDKEHLLGLLGIEQKSMWSSLFGTIGWIGIGMLAGAVTALLLAPKTGSELRESVGRTFKKTAEDFMTTARSKVDELQPGKGG